MMVWWYDVWTNAIRLCRCTWEWKKGQLGGGRCYETIGFTKRGAVQQSWNEQSAGMLGGCDSTRQARAKRCVQVQSRLSVASMTNASRTLVRMFDAANISSAHAQFAYLCSRHVSAIRTPFIVTVATSSEKRSKAWNTAGGCMRVILLCKVQEQCTPKQVARIARRSPLSPTCERAEALRGRKRFHSSSTAMRLSPWLVCITAPHSSCHAYILDYVIHIDAPRQARASSVVPLLSRALMEY